jgi:hypothetical protein
MMCQNTCPTSPRITFHDARNISNKLEYFVKGQVWKGGCVWGLPPVLRRSLLFSHFGSQGRMPLSELVRGLQRYVVCLGWPIALSYMSPNPGGGEVAGSQPMSTAVHRSPIWRFNSIFNQWSWWWLAPKRIEVVFVILMGWLVYGD